MNQIVFVSTTPIFSKVHFLLHSILQGSTRMHKSQTRAGWVQWFVLAFFKAGSTLGKASKCKLCRRCTQDPYQTKGLEKAATIPTRQSLEKAAHFFLPKGPKGHTHGEKETSISQRQHTTKKVHLKSQETTFSPIGARLLKGSTLGKQGAL